MAALRDKRHLWRRMAALRDKRHLWRRMAALERESTCRRNCEDGE
jgi:hypothetical protein